MNTTKLNPHNTQSGFGVVEMLVALAISSFLIAGVVQIYLANKQSYRMAEGLSRLQENARFSMKTLSLAMEPGGYRGCLQASPENFVNTLSIKTDDYDFGASVVGTEGGANPDSVTLRRAVGRVSIDVVEPMASQTATIRLDAADPDYADLEQYQVLMISDCAHSAVFMVTNDPQSSGGIIRHDAGVVAPGTAPNPGQSNATRDLQHIYGAKTNAVATIYTAASATYTLAPGTSGELSLFSGADELVEGVQDMQVTYGLQAGGNTQFVSAAGVTDWETVESIRVALNMNTVEPVTTVGGGGTNTIDKTYGRTFRVRNRRP